MSIGIRLKPRASESAIRRMVEAAGGVYEPPRKKAKFDPGPEHRFQIAIHKWLNLAIGAPGFIWPPGVFWCSIDTPHNTPRVNATTGRKYDLEGQMRKARGCIPNIADMEFQWGQDAFQRGKIELKAKGKPLPEGQAKYLADMFLLGWNISVIWDDQGLGEVEATLRKWGCPLKATVMA